MHPWLKVNVLARLPMFAINFAHSQAIDSYHNHMHFPLTVRYQLSLSSSATGVHPKTSRDLLQQHWWPSGLSSQVSSDYAGGFRAADQSS